MAKSGKPRGKGAGHREVSPGVRDLRRLGSGIVTKPTHMIAAWGLMKAAGVLQNLKSRTRPIVTVVNSYTTHIPGHAHLRVIEDAVAKELKRLGFTVWAANVGGAVCDGIAMGHFGMKY